MGNNKHNKITINSISQWNHMFRTILPLVAVLWAITSAWASLARSSGNSNPTTGRNQPSAWPLVTNEPISIHSFYISTKTYLYNLNGKCLRFSEETRVKPRSSCAGKLTSRNIYYNKPANQNPFTLVSILSLRPIGNSVSQLRKSFGSPNFYQPAFNVWSSCLQPINIRLETTRLHKLHKCVKYDKLYFVIIN
jgi:hypothetical protein